MRPLRDLEPHELHGLERYAHADQQRIIAALAYAKHAHADQQRIQGGPYYTHLVAVAQLLMEEFHADADTVIAGLLHDAVEDTTVTLDDVEREFGPAVRFIVDAATEYGRGDGNAAVADKWERARLSWEKIDRMAAQDPRVYLVKIADRWHNLLTCAVTYPSSQRRNAQDALDHHVVACRKLGFAEQAQLLEDLARMVVERATRMQRERGR